MAPKHPRCHSCSGTEGNHKKDCGRPLKKGECVICEKINGHAPNCPNDEDGRDTHEYIDFSTKPYCHGHDAFWGNS